MFLPRASKTIVPIIFFLSKFPAELKVNNRITHLNDFLSEQLNFFVLKKLLQNIRIQWYNIPLFI